MAVWLVLWPLPGRAVGRADEYQIKAAYLYNFTKFVTWPDDPAPTFNICLVGADPFGRWLDPIEQRAVGGRPVRVFRVPKVGGGRLSPGHCHIVFATYPATGPAASLTVGERSGFADDGGMIEFVNKEGRIKLRVNLGAVRRGGLKISAKLLEVAEIVGEEAP